MKLALAIFYDVGRCVRWGVLEELRQVQNHVFVPESLHRLQQRVMEKKCAFCYERTGCRSYCVVSSPHCHSDFLNLARSDANACGGHARGHGSGLEVSG